MFLYVSNDNYIIFLNKMDMESINFSDKKDIESNFRNLFLKIKQRLRKDICGFFNIKVYLDKNFGAIICIDKEDTSYYEYLSNQIDMQIEIEDSIMYKEYDDILDISLDEFYLYSGKYYAKALDDINNIEFSKIIYGEELKKVLEHGKKIVVS